MCHFNKVVLLCENFLGEQVTCSHRTSVDIFFCMVLFLVQSEARRGGHFGNLYVTGIWKAPVFLLFIWLLFISYIIILNPYSSFYQIYLFFHSEFKARAEIVYMMIVVVPGQYNSSVNNIKKRDTSESTMLIGACCKKRTN